MAQTVGQHGVAAFTNPSNGDPLDATVVKANDNSVRGAYVDHDSDGGIHLQSSSLAARPIAGTAGRKWLTTDAGSVKLWFDTGAAWEEISYVPTTGNPSFTNATLVGTTTNNGVITGGTLSPSTLNLPAGTVIGSGTLSNATLSGTTTNSGTISGGTVSPTTLNAPSGTSLPSPTVTGTANFTSATLSGGTVSPTTLTVPSGTTIPTHTETGTITATGSTRNGGTIAGATLNNTTFTGTVSGLNVNPTVVSASNVSSVTIGTTTTTVATLNISSAGSYLLMSAANPTCSAGAVALERVQMTATATIGGANIWSSAQLLGVTGASSTTPTSWSLGFAVNDVVTFSGAGTVTVSAYKLASGNTASVSGGACTIVAIRVN